MKKLIAILLAATMIAAAFAGCGKTETPKEPAPETALEILENTWAKFAEDEKFPVNGGSSDNSNFEGPGAITMATNASDLEYMVHVPADQIASLDDAANMMNAFNSNIFTGAALHLTEGTDLRAFATTLKDAILGTNFLCGFPEKLLIASIAGEYVIVAYGLDSEDATNISTFQTHLTEAYPAAEILFTENFRG